MVTINAANEPTAASGKVLQGQGVGTASNFSTATYPSTAGTASTILRSDGTNIVNSTPTFPNAASTSGKVIASNGTNFVTSTATFPVASAASGKFIRSDGTNWIASTPTLPTSAGTSGKVLQSNGTNYVESTPTYPSTSGTSGKVLISDGTNNVYSTPTFPNASASSGKFIRSDGTNWIASTPTLPTTGGTAGTLLKSDGTNFVNTSTAKIDSNGYYTNTSQPMLTAYLLNSQLNVTGDSTQATVIWDTVYVQQGSNYNSGTGTYTFPVTGQYYYTIQVAFLGITSSHTSGYILPVQGGGAYLITFANPYAIYNPTYGTSIITQSGIFSATASQTLIITAQVANGTKVVSISGLNVFPVTYISLSLLT